MILADAGDVAIHKLGHHFEQSELIARADGEPDIRDGPIAAEHGFITFPKPVAVSLHQRDVLFVRLDKRRYSHYEHGEREHYPYHQNHIREVARVDIEHRQRHLRHRRERKPGERDEHRERRLASERRQRHIEHERTLLLPVLTCFPVARLAQLCGLRLAAFEHFRNGTFERPQSQQTARRGEHGERNEHKRQKRRVEMHGHCRQDIARKRAIDRRHQRESQPEPDRAADKNGQAEHPEPERKLAVVVAHRFEYAEAARVFIDIKLYVESERGDRDSRKPRAAYRRRKLGGGELCLVQRDSRSVRVVYERARSRHVAQIIEEQRRNEYGGANDDGDAYELYPVL